MTGKSTSSQPDIRFSDIRTLDGKQSQGFEELCFQLLPLLVGEPLVSAVRVDGRGGDGGVEAIAKTVSGLDVGLQCKYVTSLSDVQRRQIDKSVRTVLSKHPEVVRYLVCVPLNRTPGEIKKWTALVGEWQTLDSTVAVEWVGLSELLNHLLKPEASHLRTYWFSCPDFSNDWVATQTKTAIKQLHDRYTPGLHQLTSAEERLEFLTASPRAVTTHRNQCSELVCAWRTVLRKLTHEVARLGATVDFTELQAAFDAMTREMREGDLVKQAKELVVALNLLCERAEQSVDGLFPGERTDSDAYWKLRRSVELDSALAEATELMDRVGRRFLAEDQHAWILTGDAGTGKSHLLADLATKLLAEGRACLLLVGERFASNATLAEQIPDLVNWSWSMRDLLACLSTHATITGQASILMVDAINESPIRGLWRRELLQFTTLIAEYPGVRLLVSCRSDCLESSLPPDLLNEDNTIRHHGFDLRFHEAVQAYFDGYHVRSHQYPTANPEFRNPVFLKTLCEAFRGRALPLSALTFVDVLAAWEGRVAETIEQKLDCSRRSTQRAIDEIVQALAQSESKRIAADDAERICLKHFPEQQASRSLYRNLNSEGLLQEVETQGETFVRLQYERFSDVRIAQIALQYITSKQNWLAHWQHVILPSHMVGDGLGWEAESELTAYALLLPDAVGVELVESPIGGVIRDEWARKNAKRILWDAWLGALPWRALPPEDQRIPHLFSLWAKQADDFHQVWERLFQFACIPGHPLNADRLHRYLSQLSLPVREQKWTVPLAKEDPDDQTDGVVGPFLYWADAATGKASDEQVRLAAQVLLWLTSSSNRALRDRATDVAIRVLVACPQAADVSIRLLDGFWLVNDPYVKERLLAAMCGVLPYLNELNAKPIAEFVLARFWQVDEIPPHILQREYAAFVVRHACETGLLPREHLEMLERWPQKPKPTVWTEAQVDVYDKDPAFGSIAHSLRPEEMGWYGDFGRYVMGSAVHHFQDDERAEPETKGMGRGGEEHDARFARRYIWQRIIELGWTPARFSEFERSLGYSSRMGHEKRIERISKKYQWIGLYEYLGNLSDSLLFREWNGSARPLRGAWELHERNYHPELAFGVGEKRDRSADGVSSWWVFESPVPATLNSVEEKRSWVQSAFMSFESYLRVEDGQQRCVVLHTHLNFDEDLGFGVERFTSAQMSQWIDVRAFLVPRGELSSRLKRLQSNNFYGDGCDVPKATQCWVSEYPWHPSFQEVDEYCLDNHTWFRGSSGKGFYLPVCEISDDDRSVMLPAPSLHRDLGQMFGKPLTAPRLTETGFMEIFDQSGRCVIKACGRSGPVLLIDEVVLEKYLTARGLVLVWAVLSEKSAWNGSKHVGGLAHQCAVYVLESEGRISGGHTVGHKQPAEE
ncbi:hypothetical protein RQP54_03735 [Curvibacter sp. APW13]|uniref:hypothetical protein n=1 Tax=Curvibacter sp. APW13 TaxID=3077236 RepID=UPI0028DF2AA3|nr:hypothetical protein [Curvibacter sp. APW13]MDT8989965.1 hypothetical protein [Curvibacter sp. APW13]